MTRPSNQNAARFAVYPRGLGRLMKRPAIILTGFVILFPSLILLATCRKSRESARSQLQQKRIEFTDQAFFERINQGDVETTGLFLDAGISPNTKDQTGSTALHLAALRGDDPIIRLLLKHEADVNIKTNIGETPLMIAALRGFPETVRLLLAAGADVRAKDDRGGTPLMHALERNHSEIAEILKAAGAKE